MYQILVRRYNRWYDIEEVVEHEGGVERQMQALYKTKNKLKDRNEISRKLIKVDDDGNHQLIEETRY